MLTFLDSLPVEKRQPNIFLGAVRYLSEDVLSWVARCLGMARADRAPGESKGRSPRRVSLSTVY